MKRDHHHITPQPDPPSSMVIGKSKLWEESGELESGNGMDELLADLGYKVKTSDMAEVAQKLEQLEEFMMGHQVHDNYSISNLVSETVHYNPSDLDTWLGSMLTGFHSLPPLPPSTTSSHVNHSNHLPQNLDGRRVLFEDPSPSSSVNTAADVVISPNNKRLKSIPSVTGGGSATLSVVLVDSQENGIQLVHALMACAEAVQRNDLSLADALMKRIGFLAGSQAGAMGKVAKFFAEGLARRIYRICPENGIDHDSVPDLLQMHFYESCPYLKFAHFTANQAIREAFEGKKSVHVIDFSINQGAQWPVLIQALALRPGGPPAFRLTGVGPPARDDSDYLQDVGRRLSQLATAINVKFEYRGIVTGSLAELDASMLELRPSDVESVVVNSVFEAHKLLALPGAMEKVLSVVKEIKPEIMTIVEQEANHNGPVFVDRFNESLHYYSTLFDSLEGSVDNQNKMMSEVYLGKQICDVVACEGPDRVERHEPLNQWRERFLAAGFEPVHLGSNAYKQASMLLAFFEGGDGYRVVENDGALMLGWHTRPLIATSAWKPNGQRNHHNHHHHHHHHHTP